jgi:uncharacterized glyoxalase superfamily protein PhnB
MPDPTIIPCLFYRDAPAAIAWLQRAFGFRALSVTPGRTTPCCMPSWRSGRP